MKYLAKLLLVFSVTLMIFTFISCTEKKETKEKNLEITTEEKEIIRSYLSTEGISKLTEGTDAYTVFEVLGLEKNEIYLWCVQESKNDVKSKSSMPVKLTIDKSSGTLVVKEMEVPREGAFFGEDIEFMFPKDVVDKIFNVDQNIRLERLDKELEKLKNKESYSSMRIRN